MRRRNPDTGRAQSGGAQQLPEATPEPGGGRVPAGGGPSPNVSCLTSGPTSAVAAWDLGEDKTAAEQRSHPRAKHQHPTSHVRERRYIQYKTGKDDSVPPLNLTSDTSLGPFRAETTPRGREAPALAIVSVVRTETSVRGETEATAAKAGPFPRCCLLSALMSEDLPTLGIPITMAQYSRFCQGTRAESQGSTQTTHGLLWPMLGNPQAEVCDQGEEDQGGGPARLSRATPPFLLREKEHAG